jgi:hypothetical protein
MRYSFLVLRLVLAFLLFGGLGLAQPKPDSTETQKLALEREQFEFEKKQSNRTLFLGFLLTTVGGAYITWLLSTRTWSRQTKMELHRKRFEEGNAFLEDFSKGVGLRFFLLQRYLWALGGGDAQRVARAEKDYFKNLAEWNSQYWHRRNKIRLLIDDSQANAFLDYQDDFRPQSPESLHYLFVKAHAEVQRVKDGTLSTKEAQSSVDTLNWACSTYLENLTTLFLERAASVQLLQTPMAQESSLKSGLSGGRTSLAVPPRLWNFQPTSHKTGKDRSSGARE